MLLGEAHYGDPEPDATIRYTTEYVNEEWSHRCWTITMQIVTGKHHWEIDRKEFWDNVAFYNYIEEPVGDGPRERPTEEIWANAQEPLLEVLRQLKPSHLLVLGGELWENLPQEGRRGPDLHCPLGARDTWFYSWGSGNALATWVYHPSSIKGANSANSWPYVEQLLTVSI